ncbi:P68 family surface lipoprotein [Mycoplasma sp. AC157]
MKKKTLLTLSSLTLAGASLTGLVSCSRETRFDQTNDETIKIANTFGSTGAQTEALQAIVEKWNNKAEVKDTNNKNYLKLELFAINGGYNGLTSDLEQKLTAKAANSLYNVAFNYPAIVGTLAKYNMQLDLNGSTPEEKAVKLAEAVRSTFSDKFLQSNTQIAGISKKGDKDSLWLIPSSRSSQVITINKEVFGYIIRQATAETLGNKKATIKAEDKAFFDEITKSNHDETFVKTVWKDYVASTKAEGGLGGYEFRKDVFESYDSLFDLVSRIKKSFPKAPEGDINKRAENVFGVDSISSLLYLMAFSDVDGDYSKFLFGLNDKQTSVDYVNALKKGTERNELFKKSFEKIAKLINEKSLFIKENSDYSSNRLKGHQLAFAIASTAGYRHNFSKNGYSEYILTINSGSKKIEDKVTADYANYIYKPTAEEIAKGVIAKLYSASKTVDANTKYVYIYDKNGTGASEFNKEGNKNIEATQEWKDALQKLSKFSNAAAGEKLGISSTNSSFKDLKEEIEQKYIIPAGKSGGYDAYLIDIKWEKTDQSDGFRKVSHDSTETLQENELGYVSNPFYTTKTDNAKKTIIAQGPSLIGIHSNKVEDLATLNFLKWYITEKQDWTVGKDDKAKNYTNLTPLEFFGQHSGYIVASEGVLSKEAPAGYDKFNKEAFGLFKKATEGADKDQYAIYEDPTDSRSSTFRDGIDTSFTNYADRAANNKGKAETFEEYLAALKNLLGASFTK